MQAPKNKTGVIVALDIKRSMQAIQQFETNAPMIRSLFKTVIRQLIQDIDQQVYTTFAVHVESLKEQTLDEIVNQIHAQTETLQIPCVYPEDPGDLLRSKHIAALIMNVCQNRN